jgi:hypothetical protein
LPTSGGSIEIPETKRDQLLVPTRAILLRQRQENAFVVYSPPKAG